MTTSRRKKKPPATRRQLSWEEYEQWRDGKVGALRRALHEELRVHGKRAYAVYSPGVRGTGSYPDGNLLFYVHADDKPEFYR